MSEHDCAECATKQRQIDDLQKRGSALENERRMWKSRATALRTIIDSLVETASVTASKGADVIGEERSKNAILEVAERVWLLEHDAWTQTTQVAKSFVRDVKGIIDLNAREPDCDAKILAFAKLVDSTFDRFKAILGDD